MSAENRLTREFYTRDVLSVAPELIGYDLVRRFPDGTLCKYMITETEAYRGSEDLACHVSKGRTSRTEIMFHEGGRLYIYFIYGMYHMLNIVTESENIPQAVLIRGLEGINGPGKLTRVLGIDKSFYGEDLTNSGRIWIEKTEVHPFVRTGTRIGVDYAGEFWKSRLWRFYI